MFCCVKAIDCLASDYDSLDIISRYAQCPTECLLVVTYCKAAGHKLLRCLCNFAAQVLLLHSYWSLLVIACRTLYRFGGTAIIAESCWPQVQIGQMNSPYSCCVSGRLQKFPHLAVTRQIATNHWIWLQGSYNAGMTLHWWKHCMTTEGQQQRAARFVTGLPSIWLLQRWVQRLVPPPSFPDLSLEWNGWKTKGSLGPTLDHLKLLSLYCLTVSSFLFFIWLLQGCCIVGDDFDDVAIRLYLIANKNCSLWVHFGKRVYKRIRRYPSHGLLQLHIIGQPSAVTAATCYTSVTDIITGWYKCAVRLSHAWCRVCKVMSKLTWARASLSLRAEAPPTQSSPSFGLAKNFTFSSSTWTFKHEEHTSAIASCWTLYMQWLEMQCNPLILTTVLLII